MTTKEWAVTEEIEYTVQKCGICSTETAVNNKVPDDALESNGYAVIVSEGNAIIETEKEGNWDTSVKFELPEESSTLPNTSGYILCESCASTIHQHPENSKKYYGKIPDEIASKTEFSLDNTVVIYLLAIIIFLLIVFVIL